MSVAIFVVDLRHANSPRGYSGKVIRSAPRSRRRTSAAKSALGATDFAEGLSSCGVFAAATGSRRKRCTRAAGPGRRSEYGGLAPDRPCVRR